MGNYTANIEKSNQLCYEGAWNNEKVIEYYKH